VTTDDRQAAALADFDRAGGEFRELMVRAPEASLGYLKPGDDYALGGLVYHVNAVLEHYLGALQAMRDSGFQETETRDRPGLFEEANARAKLGLAPEERAGALAATERLHRDVKATISGLAPDDFERKVPVRFEAGGEPYQASTADVLSWLEGHYREHVPQAEQLLDEWRAR
jgi:DinB superfamily